MHIPKNYFHDRLILLLLSVNTFLAGLMSVLILLRLDSSRAESYIVQYRASLGVNSFKSGDGSTFIGFIVFGIFIVVMHTLLSMRVYSQHRRYAIVALSLALLLLIMALFVSNALLVQR
jgi:hypothetical protein